MFFHLVDLYLLIFPNSLMFVSVYKVYQLCLPVLKEWSYVDGVLWGFCSPPLSPEPGALGVSPARPAYAFCCGWAIIPVGVFGP